MNLSKSSFCLERQEKIIPTICRFERRRDIFIINLFLGNHFLTTIQFVRLFYLISYGLHHSNIWDVTNGLYRIKAHLNCTVNVWKIVKSQLFTDFNETYLLTKNQHRSQIWRISIMDTILKGLKFHFSCSLS